MRNGCAHLGDAVTEGLIVGDVRDILPTLPDGIAQTCVTSPPYWGLRDYGVEGQLGLETTPDAFVETMVSIFREVRRVLRDDGTLWLNLGDSYGNGGAAPPRRDHSGGKSIGTYGQQGYAAASAAPWKATQQPKGLIGIPWRVALALQADGWILRSDIIWAKPNPMPESVTDRPTKSHEYLFLLAKQGRYYYDADAIREEGEGYGRSNWNAPQYSGDRTRHHGGKGTHGRGGGTSTGEGGRNKRSVWSVASDPFEDAHFATFPRKLIEPCIAAGSRTGDLVLDPFMGSGTVGMVAQDLGRRWLGCELNSEYAAMIHRRTAQMAMAL